MLPKQSIGTQQKRVGSRKQINAMKICQRQRWIMKVTRYYKISTYKQIMALNQGDLI